MISVFLVVSVVAILLPTNFLQMDTSNKIHHSALAKFRQAVSENTNQHLQHLQQTPQVASSIVDQVYQKQKEAFQPLTPVSTSRLQPAESVLTGNDPFHTDNLRVPYSSAFQTSMTNSSLSSSDLPEDDNSDGMAKTDMSIVTNVRTIGDDNRIIPPVQPTTTSTNNNEHYRNELRNIHQKIERLSYVMETMQATTKQLFYDFMVYLMLGVLIVFTLDQYISQRQLSTAMSGGGSIHGDYSYRKPETIYCR